MKRYVIMREANSLEEIENIINEIYQDAEQKGFGYKVENLIKTDALVTNNMYSGYNRTKPCYTVLIEISTEGSNQ